MAKLGYNVNTIRIQRDTRKEIPGLKYLMKLFQNQKLESELNDFQSILIVLSHSPFLNEEVQISKKWVKGKLILGVIFSFLAIIVTDTAFTF